MSPIIASDSLSLWYNSPHNPFEKNCFKNYPTILTPASPISLLLFLFFSSATFPTIGRLRRRFERERGSFLIELFFFPCTLPRVLHSSLNPLSSATPSPRSLTVRSAFVSSALHVGLPKNFTLTFMLGRNLQHSEWNFLRELYGAYWNHFNRIFLGYVVILIIIVLFNFLFTLIKNIQIERIIYFFFCLFIYICMLIYIHMY